MGRHVRGQMLKKMEEAGKHIGNIVEQEILKIVAGEDLKPWQKAVAARKAKAEARKEAKD